MCKGVISATNHSLIEMDEFDSTNKPVEFDNWRIYRIYNSVYENYVKSWISGRNLIQYSLCATFAPITMPLLWLFRKQPPPLIPPLPDLSCLADSCLADNKAKDA